MVGFLTKSEFLSHFPIISMSKSDFTSKITVMYSVPQTLDEIFKMVPPTPKRKPIIKNTSDKRYIQRDKLVDYYYEIVITNRHKYLGFFYDAYFCFQDPAKLKWKVLKATELRKYDNSGSPLVVNDIPVISIQKNDASRRIIRNLFYLELLHYTNVSNTVKSKVSFWESLTNLYNKLQLEDRFFAPSSVDLVLKDKGTQREKLSGIKEINYNTLFYLFQAYQPKASIFNPYAIKYMLTELISSKKKKLFTPVMSWCSYLVAFMHINGFEHYVGNDVMASVCEKAKFLGKWYNDRPEGKSKKVDIMCTPSEELHLTGFTKDHSNYFDTILLCPPYYDMELYHEGKQSTDTFKTYSSWLTGYWEQTVKNCHSVCEKGGTFAVIANDYKTLKGKNYPLTSDLDSITKKYFTPYSSSPVYYLQNRTSPLRAAGKDRTERLFLYSK